MMKRIIYAVAFTAAMVLNPVGATAVDTQLSGSFAGANDHVTTGGVTVVKTADGGAVVILDSDFSLDGAPDPHVGFGKSGTFDEAADLGKLEKTAGLQVYLVPASVDVGNYDELYIWCLEFNVSLGMAALN